MCLQQPQYKVEVNESALCILHLVTSCREHQFMLSSRHSTEHSGCLQTFYPCWLVRLNMTEMYCHLHCRLCLNRLFGRGSFRVGFLCTICAALHEAAEPTVAVISPDDLKTRSRGSRDDQSGKCRHTKFLFLSSFSSGSFKWWNILEGQEFPCECSWNDCAFFLTDFAFRPPVIALMELRQKCALQGWICMCDVFVSAWDNLCRGSWAHTAACLYV